MISVQVYPYVGTRERLKLIKDKLKDKRFTDVGNALFIYENDGIFEEENAYKLCKSERRWN